MAALGQALGDENTDIRTGVVKIFTAAMAQGVISHLHGIFILNYLQRAFETIYIMQRLSLHLDMH